MNRKRLIGFALLVIGIGLIILAMHFMNEIAHAKGVVKDVSDFFNKDPAWNPFVEFFGGAARAKISEYDAPTMITLISGIVLCIVGGIMAIVCKRKK